MATHRKIMKDDYSGAINWYRCEMQNLNFKDEDGATLNSHLDGPALMVVAKGDPFSNETVINRMKELAANLKIVEIKGTHWIQLEKPDEVNVAVKEHIESV
jgi:pimeloyl-ACP methyl ester carboxylesterase